MRTLTSALLAAGLIGLSLPSLAQSSPTAQASIDWSSFSVQLFDLNPTDDVAASLTWVSQTTNADSMNYGAATSTPSFDHSSDWSSVVAAAVSGGNSSADGSSLSASSTAVGGTSNSSYVYRSGIFTLTPMTLVTFSVDATVADTQPPGSSGYSNASATLTTSQSNPLTGLSIHNSSTLYSYYASDDISGVLSTSFVNLSGVSQSAYLSASAYANSTNYATAPVPEPETYAMLLAGLAVMAGLARRRRAG